MPLNIHETYMQRCIDLAVLGASTVAPNPMVGAVLVYNNRIIGEGYHQVYGGPHAEVNCIHSVKVDDRALIGSSSLYVSLEPCAHFGKTPPCADLIIAHNIPQVYIGSRDPFHAVNGKGIDKLTAAGTKVVQGVLENRCDLVNRKFFVQHKQHRPYIVLKWAETANGKIGNTGNNRLMISSAATNRLVHKWRSELMAIMVGTNTAMMDDPQLTNRWWYGKDPVRVVLDADLSLPTSLRLFSESGKTIVFNTLKHDEHEHVSYYQYSEDASIVHQVLNGLYQMNIQSVMIEGGARLLQSFIDDGSWDEVRTITNPRLRIPEGVLAPNISNAKMVREEMLGNDIIRYYEPHK